MRITALDKSQFRPDGEECDLRCETQDCDGRRKRENTEGDSFRNHDCGVKVSDIAAHQNEESY
jgi:hypothetical protein